MSNFKMFKGGKSKAVKGLIRFNALLAGSADELLKKVDGEWGFDADAAEAILSGATPDQTETPADSDPVNPLDRFGESDDEFKAGCFGEPEAAPQAEVDPEADGEAEDNFAPVASGNMFGGIAATLGNVAAHAPAPTAPATRSANRTAYTIEKDRPQQNGIKRPSAGGLCRRVWDEMDHVSELIGMVPTTENVREAAKANGWNLNNAMIEYYQWRKYNGITGRAKKVAAVVEEGANKLNQE